ncbi:COG4 transport protein-domain-containing protein [Melampsora americana]|nr:COG4 transport protein-domain-containing protein [Melampsora americana]
MTIDNLQSDGLLPSNSPIHSRQHLATLQSHRDIITALAQLEFSLDNSLADLLSSPERLEEPLKQIDDLRPLVSSLAQDASTLHEVVTERAAVAERISSKVRILDLEQNRVKECIDRVQAATELKDALVNVFQAIEKADWEAATRHIQRANGINPEMIRSQFAEAVVPTTDIPEPPSIALENFTNQLTEIFLKAFTQAANSKDEATTTRFFKLFPLLGSKASESGLAAYSSFVRTLISLPRPTGTGSSQPKPEISNYTFPALNQLLTTGTTIHNPLPNSIISNLNVSNPSASYVPSSINSPVGLQSSLRSFAGNVQRTYNLQPSLSAMSGTSNATAASIDNEMPDLKAIDAIIAELTGMSGRWQTYRRFLYARFGDEGQELDDNDTQETVQKPTDPTQPSSPTTEFSKTIYDLLNSLYSPLEVWYLRVSNELDLSSTPYLSSALDDTFYMIKKVLYRSINSGQVTCLKNMIRAITEIAQRDFGEVIKHRLDNVGTAIGGTGFGIGIGSKSGEGKDKREKNVINSYIVYLNDLDMASDYIVKLVEEVIGGDALYSSFFIRKEFGEAETSLNELKLVQSNFSTITKNGLEQLFTQLIRPRIRPILTDCYKDVNYYLDEERYAEAESQDFVRKRFIRAWESLIDPYQTGLTPNNFHQVFSATVNMISRPWETQIRNMKFTELGAMRFDRDLRSISSYLSNQTSFGISLINESFIRLRQISMLLGLNEKEDDLKDFLVSDEITWRLSMVEIKSVLSQKS